MDECSSPVEIDRNHPKALALHSPESFALRSEPADLTRTEGESSLFPQPDQFFNRPQNPSRRVVICRPKQEHDPTWLQDPPKLSEAGAYLRLGEMFHHTKVPDPINGVRSAGGFEDVSLNQSIHAGEVLCSGE